MRNIPIVVLILMLAACKRDAELPLSAIPGRIGLNNQNGEYFQYFPKTGEYFSLGSQNPARWSHNGALLLVAGTEGGQSYNAVLDAHTLEVKLRINKQELSGFCWSPDDREIAYLSGNRIVRLNLETQVEYISLLPSDYEFNSEMDWSPDGTRFVLCGRNPEFYLESALCSVRADGSDYRVLAIGPFQNPRWSPDGTQIAFNDVTNIHLMKADGSNDHVIIKTAQNPCWSADGSILMYTFIVYGDWWEEGEIHVKAREIDGDQREREINYTGMALTDWSPVE